MPLFDFVCDSCGNKQEILVQDEGNEQVCSCGAKMHKVFSPRGQYVKFCGSGWWSTDWGTQVWNSIHGGKDKSEWTDDSGD